MKRTSDLPLTPAASCSACLTGVVLRVCYACPAKKGLLRVNGTAVLHIFLFLSFGGWVEIKFIPFGRYYLELE